MTSPDICIDQFDYKPSLHQDILSADLVIAHAGAGTCLEGELCRDDRYKSLGTIMFSLIIIQHYHFLFSPSVLVLERRKPLIVVVNNKLMNNHQSELAEKLGDDGYLEHCICSTLAETITHFDESTKKIFPSGDLEKFRTFIDNMFSTKESNVETKAERVKRQEESATNADGKEESEYLK